MPCRLTRSKSASRLLGLVQLQVARAALDQDLEIAAMAGQHLVEAEERFLVVPGVIELDALGPRAVGTTGPSFSRAGAGARIARLVASTTRAIRMVPPRPRAPQSYTVVLRRGGGPPIGMSAAPCAGLAGFDVNAQGSGGNENVVDARTRACLDVRRRSLGSGAV